MTDTENEFPPIRFLRLKNGDDIVCEVVEIGDDNINNYILINPYKVVYMPASERGYIQIAFMPWVFSRISDKQEFMIKSEDVLMITDVSAYMEKYYWDSMENHLEQKQEHQEEPQHMEPDEDGLEQLAEILQQLDAKRTLH